MLYVEYMEDYLTPSVKYGGETGTVRAYASWILL